MKLTRFTLLVALALTVASCNRGPRQVRPAINPELVSLSKEQAFQRAEDNFSKKKWQRARTFYTHVYESYPNDPLGRRSLLRVADTYFQQGDPVNLVEAQYKYRDFINRYPTSEQADYAMLQIAMVSYRQMERPDRDQQKTKEAVDKFNEMLRSYPRSPLRAEAEKHLQEALDRLARHELIVARFYIKRGSSLAAIQRLNFAVDTYPNFSERDAIFFDLANALAMAGRNGEARLYYERVLTEFPTSEFAARSKRKLEQMKA